MLTDLHPDYVITLDTWVQKQSYRSAASASHTPRLGEVIDINHIKYPKH